MSEGLLDTSVWIAAETGRSLDLAALPDHAYVSVITLAEVEAGVLAALDTETRSRRMATVAALAAATPLPVDGEAARQWAVLRVQVHEAGRRVNVNDMWIAATALANRLPVVTQDGDFDVLSELSGLEVIQV